VYDDARLQQIGDDFPLVFGHGETGFLAKWEAN
jgi:hypothetical protein